ncbi:UNVERIFIED_CONTAM: hypothetical protein B566_EDAN017879, partial [Ephemera danica]
RRSSERGGHCESPPSRDQDARAEQRLPRRRVRRGRRRQEFARAALRQGNLPRVLHSHHRGYLQTGDQLQQEHLHAADHRHHRLTSVPGHAAPQHLQGARVHPGLLGHLLTVARGAPPHLGGHEGGQGRLARGNPGDAGGQQGGRGIDTRGERCRGRGRSATLGLQLHGDVSENQPQRQGTVPGTAQSREEPQHLTAVRLQEQESERHQQNQGKVHCRLNFTSYCKYQFYSKIYNCHQIHYVLYVIPFNTELAQGMEGEQNILY